MPAGPVWPVPFATPVVEGMGRHGDVLVPRIDWHHRCGGTAAGSSPPLGPADGGDGLDLLLVRSGGRPVALPAHPVERMRSRSPGRWSSGTVADGSR
jgi:hypothetical protein